MGGKGRKRREKNFQAAHGGYTRLPPPPKSSDIDALPSKLRKLMELTSTTDPSTTLGSLKVSTGAENKRKRREKSNPKDELSTDTLEFKGGQDEYVTLPKHEDDGDEVAHKDIDDKRKKKRKRKQVHDLRFETTTQDLGIVGIKRRDRKKKYLEAKKKKHKKDKTEENLDFPGREEIKFGEVVEAPPKLVSFPKALKTVQSASHERLRLQAVEAYRSRKAWVSRPGIHLTPPINVTPSS